MNEELMSINFARWRRVQDFVAAWHRPLVPSDGLDLIAIRAAENHLGFSLPRTLQEWYLLAGRRKDLNATQDFFYSPDALRVNDHILVFYEENQACYDCGSLLSTLDQPDPPVLVTNGMNWVAHSPSLSEFIYRMVLYQTQATGKNYFGGRAQWTAELGQVIAAQFPALAYYYRDGHPESLVEYFGNAETLISIERADWPRERERIFLVNTQTRAAFTRIQALIPTLWRSVWEAAR